MRRREALAALAGAAFAPALAAADDLLRQLVAGAGPTAQRVLANAGEFRPQLLWTRCVRAAGGWRAQRTHALGLRPRAWFAAASFIKLPLAALLIEELERRGLDWIDGDLRVEVDAAHACAPLPTPQAGGWPLLALLQAMLVVSDNLAYNVLFELLGSDAIHTRLAALGFPHVRMATRLGCPQPRSPGKLAARVRGAGGALAWDSPAQSTERFQRFPFGAARAGRAWMENGVATPGAHDFADSNFLPLADVHRCILELGGGVEPRFALSLRARRWCADTLARVPRSATLLDPERRQWPDDHSKWLVPAGADGRLPDALRIASKNAQSYGWIGDTAFIVDSARDIGFALSVVLDVDRDGVLNDGVYAYADIGRPFLREVGAAVLAYERSA